MATITKTVGTTGRGYTTLAAAYASVPANLVSDGNSYILDCYNDSEFSSASNLLAISGNTTDSTHTLTVKAATSNSFSDNASAQTNLLDYIQANGVGIKMTGTYDTAITNSVANVSMSGLQVSCTGSPSAALTYSGSASGVISSCILKAKPTSGNVVLLTNSGTSLINSVAIAATSDACTGVSISLAAKTVNCTVVRPSNYTAGGKAFTASYGAAQVTNCAIFGFTTTAAVGTGGSYAADGHNCTEQTTAPGSTSNQVSKTFANQFAQSSDASVLDLKIVTGSDCKNNGVTDTTDIPSGLDIVGTTRSSWDIGAWEFVSAAAGLPPGRVNFVRQAVNRASRY